MSVLNCLPSNEILRAAAIALAAANANDEAKATAINTLPPVNNN